jgi:hypothetical protein
MRRSAFERGLRDLHGPDVIIEMMPENGRRRFVQSPPKRLTFPWYVRLAAGAMIVPLGLLILVGAGVAIGFGWLLWLIVEAAMGWA